LRLCRHLRTYTGMCSMLIMFYINEDIPLISSTSHPSLELLAVKISLKQGSLPTFLYYCPPSAPLSHDSLEAALHSLNPSQSSAILLGDFNINLLVSNDSSRSMLSAFHLHQILTQPTRVTRTPQPWLIMSTSHILISYPLVLPLHLFIPRTTIAYCYY